MYQNDSHKTLQAKLRKIETSRNTKVQLEQLEKGMLSKKTNYNTLVFKRAKKQAELLAQQPQQLEHGLQRDFSIEINVE